MKNSFLFSLLIISLFSWACEGPTGPPGPQGPPGYDGYDGEPGPDATVIEFENVDFRPPNFRLLLDFPDWQPLRTDAILVYALWDTEIEENGSLKDIWRLLPQTFFVDAGTLILNYDHSYKDVELKLEANFDIAAADLGPNYLDDWVIRLVFIPGKDISEARKKSPIDFNDYDAVKKYYNLPDAPKRNKVHSRPQAD